MPSGSHGGSRGSHSSGGSRSSSSGSFGGGYGGSRTYRSSRPFIITIGHRVYSFGWKLSIFLVSFFLSAFFLVVFASQNYHSKETIKIIETDFIYYKAMVQRAENDPRYKKIGTITDYFYNSDCDKWYYTYEIEIEDVYMPLEGYTYSLYTFDQISKIRIGDEIEIAVNNPDVDLNTDSVPMDFKHFELEDDGEYIDAIKLKKSSTIITIIASIITAGVIVGAIVYMVKTKKREDLETEKKSVREQEKHELEKKALERNLEWRCEYCANLNKPEKTKCSNCGAGRTK